MPGSLAYYARAPINCSIVRSFPWFLSILNLSLNLYKPVHDITAYHSGLSTLTKCHCEAVGLHGTDRNHCDIFSFILVRKLEKKNLPAVCPMLLIANKSWFCHKWKLWQDNNNCRFLRLSTNTQNFTWYLI